MDLRGIDMGKIVRLLENVGNEDQWRLRIAEVRRLTDTVLQWAFPAVLLVAGTILPWIYIVLAPVIVVFFAVGATGLVVWRWLDVPTLYTEFKSSVIGSLVDHRRLENLSLGGRKSAAEGLESHSERQLEFGWFEIVERENSENDRHRDLIFDQTETRISRSVNQRI
jgi:hypothetical protein